MAIFKVSKVRISNYEPEVSIILDYDELERIFICLLYTSDAADE